MVGVHRRLARDRRRVDCLDRALDADVCCDECEVVRGVACVIVGEPWVESELG